MNNLSTATQTQTRFEIGTLSLKRPSKKSNRIYVTISDMKEKDDLTFQAMIEKGIPLVILEQRLRPALNRFQNEPDTFSDYSDVGFLGSNESLLDIIQSDWKTVSDYGTSHKAIAQAIRNANLLYVFGSKQKAYPIPNLHPDFEYLPPIGMSVSDQTCPWGDRNGGKNSGIIIRKDITETERSYMEFWHSGLPVSFQEKMLRAEGKESQLKEFANIQESLVSRKRNPFYAPLTGLLPHLIENHYFFEGRESPYRADPEFLINAFGLGKKTG